MVLCNKKLKEKIRSILTETSIEKLDVKSPKVSVKKKDIENSEIQSLKVVLDTKTKKRRLSLREKNKKDVPFEVIHEGTNDDTKKENKKQSGLVELNDGDEKKEEKKKKKKTKDDAEAEEKEKARLEAAEKRLMEKRAIREMRRKRKREELEEGEGKEKKENGGGLESAEKKKSVVVNKKKKKKKRKTKTKKKKVSKDAAVGDDDKVIVDDKVVVVENNVDTKEEPMKIDESQEIVEIATKVYVGGIPYYSTEDDIRSFFESCGTITELECMSFPDTGKFRGIAMISFKTDAAAKRALALDGADMGGLFLKIQPYKTTTSRPQKSLSADFAPKIVEGYNRVYVGNLAWDITEDDLKQLFKGCKISSVRFGTDKETGEFRGYAHVDFEDSLSLAMALKLDQKEVCGRPARISCAVPKNEAKAGSKPLGPQIVKAENGSINQVTIDKKAVNESSIPISEAKVENENGNTLTSSVSGVKKRRTCCECGVAGHISSDSPMKKQAVDTVNMEMVEEETSYPMFISEEKFASETSNTVSSTKSGVKKRRTCYECGIAGHISSDCPQKNQAGDPVNKPQVIETSYPRNEERVENENSNTMSSAKSGGKKRRTCYECGVAGHISTECPKKNQAVDPINNVKVDDESSNPVAIEKVQAACSLPLNNEKVENDSSNIVASTKSSGKKRRTCYECGVSGHISTDCPKKQQAA
ncbi:protein gar2-like [Papaver somniferum]|uniref:protein gar2-like n=1 Tax=Papaver somniferum TaxID=3469 RepID=UPI000E703A67|nr:protein gar2-like [Papaver somniferum]